MTFGGPRYKFNFRIGIQYQSVKLLFSNTCHHSLQTYQNDSVYFDLLISCVYFGRINVLNFMYLKFAYVYVFILMLCFNVSLQNTLLLSYLCLLWSVSACNCYNHANTCIFDQNVANSLGSLNAAGIRSGGGVCQNCQNNTAGLESRLIKKMYIINLLTG